MLCVIFIPFDWIIYKLTARGKLKETRVIHCSFDVDAANYHSLSRLVIIAVNCLKTFLAHF